jgi:HK97 family phage major capsid protein
MSILSDSLADLVSKSNGKDHWGSPSPGVCRQQRAALLDRCGALTALAEKEKRDLAEDEKTLFDSAVAKARKLGNMAESMDDADVVVHRPVGPQRCDGPGDGDFSPQGHNSMNSAITPQATWQDKHGQPIRILGRGQRLADLPENRGVLAAVPNGFGHFLAALIDPNRRKHAPAEIRAAMSESAPGAGGVLVPSQLSAQVIDAARATSVCFRAGARTLPMASATLDLARVSGGPTFVTHGENESITESDVVFDAISLVSRTLATRVVVSRELVEDASNLVQLLQDVIVRSLSAELDRQFLVGAAGDEMAGVAVTPGVSSTSSVGPISWIDLVTAVTTLQASNFEPNCYVASPTIAGDLNALQSGDGATSAALWQGPPPGVDQLQRYVTSNMPDTQIIVGDFSKLLVGLRQDALVEVSAFGDGFDSHSLHVKCTWRGDVALAQAAAFHLLDGITT